MRMDHVGRGRMVGYEEADVVLQVLLPTPLPIRLLLSLSLSRRNTTWGVHWPLRAHVQNQDFQATYRDRVFERTEVAAD